ncbi:MAG: hypothetical protein A2312_02505 [Candidatus Staskawiczbacteria bacterium RIFOXYB2_FULL_32_9]|nr:MAG: hypothetical protein A2312_02505 [Candidatus Staskawiczbacteria bacterium RIFOXYB2_FULL_32_9]
MENYIPLQIPLISLVIRYIKPTNVFPEPLFKQPSFRERKVYFSSYEDFGGGCNINQPVFLARNGKKPKQSENFMRVMPKGAPFVTTNCGELTNFGKK